MSTPTPDQVQLAVLQALDSAPDGTLADSRTLTVGGRPMAGAADQILVKAAVDSLLRREVRPFRLLFPSSLRAPARWG